MFHQCGFLFIFVHLMSGEMELHEQGTFCASVCAIFVLKTMGLRLDVIQRISTTHRCNYFSVLGLLSDMRGHQIMQEALPYAISGQPKDVFFLILVVSSCMCLTTPNLVYC